MTTVAVISITAVAAVAITAAVSSFYFRRRTGRKVAYMVDAIEDNETNFHFKESFGIDRRINKTLNRLRGIYGRDMDKIREQEKFYGLMLDQVLTGVLVYEVSSQRVIYCNSRAQSLLGVSGIVTLRQLKNTGIPLFEVFERVAEDNPEKASVTTESSTISLSLNASCATIGGKAVKIVSFNDISEAMEENESESWTKLIRVLTHEIMNTVTPVASLSETLQTFEASPEVRSGLETISSSSRGLVRFVDSYRNLTHVAPPKKKAFYVRDMVSGVLELTRETARERGAVVSFVEKSEDVLLYADEGQISQILINLVKNAVQAGAHKVDITAEIDTSESVLVCVSNDGAPISATSREEIFVPFFTTKQEGTGIGLSLSRQIMRLNGGSLRLTKSDQSSTVFTLTFR